MEYHLWIAMNLRSEIFVLVRNKHLPGLTRAYIMTTSVDTLYLPRIAETRDHVALGIAGLLAKFDHEEPLLGFLLEYCAMRIGPLQPIPRWLRAAARTAKAAGQLGVGEDLALAAEREQDHRLLLIADLVAQRELWVRRVGPCGIGLHALVRQQTDPAVAQHAQLREAAASDPLAMIATELELAEFGRVFGQALVDACRSILGTQAEDCLGFVQARAEDAYERASLRFDRLDALLAEHPERAAAWAKVAGRVIRSYILALDSCTERRHELHGRGHELRTG